MALTEYKRKRKFDRTPEPTGEKDVGKKRPKLKTGKNLRYVVQKHKASRLHYDFRLEQGGVLKSWAVPKGPSLDPEEKRLAMMTEDHPLDYLNFEGTIPKGNYGAGEVIVWDHGLYHSADVVDDPEESREKLKEGLRKGRLDFILFGKKLKGRFALIKMKRKEDVRGKSWLLMKQDDEYASTRDIAEDASSVISGRELL
ncbi:MAG: DNA polymerase ligase N-terminal domain-containing protein [bacterium]|nr:DNA polymerase ligase N-terminal domain-containing protein [bacterium]